MKITLSVLIIAFLILSTVSFAHALIIDSVSTSEINPGKKSTITIGLENDADDDITDVSISLDLTSVPFAPFDSSSEYGIDEIREDKTKNAVFQIIALNNAKSGIYKIPVKITFKNAEDEIKTKDSLISVVVNSEPIIDLDIEEGLLLADQNNDLSIRVTNKGLSDAKFLEVEIKESSNIKFLSSNKHYIGDIDSDDFDSIDLKVIFEEDAPEKVNLPITVTYKDDLNKEYTEIFNLDLDVYTSSRAIELGLKERNLTGFYIIGVLLIIILFVVYRRLRKRMRDKKARK